MFNQLKKTTAFEGFFHSEAEGAPVSLRYEEVTRCWVGDEEITAQEFEALVAKSTIAMLVRESVQEYRDAQKARKQIVL